MQPEDPQPLDLDEALDDPELAVIAAAILDGTPIDWTSAAANAGSRHADTLRRLRVLADVAGLHRSLTPSGSNGDADLSPSSNGVGGQWGPLAIGECIGSGAFGEVFRAWDTRLDREVALKLLRRLETGESGSTVIEEGRLLARVRHPNVVTVFGAERIDGRVGIWTEFIHGQTVAAWVRARGRLEIPEAVGVALDVSRALAAVHGAGVVHGDIKAQNVLREPGGRIVLVDLGTGRELVHERAHALGGTPLYMAPELWTQTTPTPVSDLYSVGVLLYYMLTGKYPVRGATADEIREAQAEGRRVRLRDERDDLPEALVGIVDRALDPDSTKRFGSVDDLGGALARLQGELSRPPGRRALMLGAVSIAILLAAAAVALSISDGFRRLVGFPAGAAAQVPAAESRSEVVHAPPLQWGRPSRDGRYLPYSDWANGDLWLWDRVTGDELRATTAGRATFSLASPNGRQLAYEWAAGGGQFELRVINADGSGLRTLVPAGIATRYTPLEYSLDGTRLLCFLDQRDGRRDLALIAADGAIQVVERFLENVPDNASLSPDARFVVYARAQAPTIPSRQRWRRMFIAAVDGSGPRDLLPGDTAQADDRSPLWTRAGDVVFISNRGRSSHVWLIDVEDGMARGEPSIVARGVDPTAVLGLTDDGAFFHMLQKDEFDVYLIGLDPVSRRIEGQPARINPEEAGLHVGGSWSPDGLSFMYVDRKANALKVKSLQTQVSREIKALSWIGNAAPRWSPDGRVAIVRGVNLRNEPGIFSIHLESLETTLLVPFSERDDSNYGGMVEWTRDRSAIRYFHRPRGIVRRETASNGERVVIPAADIGPLSRVRFATSPDEKWLFFGGQLKDGGTVFKLGREGGAFQEVRRFPNTVIFQHWSVDGQEVYLVGEAAGEDAYHLLAMPPISSTVRDLGALPGWSLANIQIAVRADGRQVAYTQGVNSQTLWVVEHFLPTPAMRAVEAGAAERD